MADPIGVYFTNPPAKKGGGFSLWAWFKMVGLILLVAAALNLLAWLMWWFT